MNGLKKVTAYILVFVVLLMTVLAILGIWNVIDLENILRRSLTSLFVIFIASVIVLFIFSVLIKDNDPQSKNSNQQQ
ncbi:MAG: hypothetical protein ACLFM1_02225 [Bacteroidales bacterium]